MAKRWVEDWRVALPGLTDPNVVAYDFATGNGVHVIAIYEDSPYLEYVLVNDGTASLIQADIDTGGYVNVLRFVHDRFVASTTDVSVSTTQRIYTSPDGITWTLRDTFTGNPVSEIVGNAAGIFVALTTDGDGRRSTDYGVGWAAMTLPAGTSSFGWRGCWNGTVFILPRSGFGYDLIRDTDGTSWETLANPAVANPSVYASSTGLILAVSGNSTANQTPRLSTNNFDSVFTVTGAPYYSSGVYYRGAFFGEDFISGSEDERGIPVYSTASADRAFTNYASFCLNTPVETSTNILRIHANSTHVLLLKNGNELIALREEDVPIVTLVEGENTGLFGETFLFVPVSSRTASATIGFGGPITGDAIGYFPQDTAEQLQWDGFWEIYADDGGAYGAETAEGPFEGSGFYVRVFSDYSGIEDFSVTLSLSVTVFWKGFVNCREVY